MIERSVAEAHWDWAFSAETRVSLAEEFESFVHRRMLEGERYYADVKVDGVPTRIEGVVIAIKAPLSGDRKPFVTLEFVCPLNGLMDRDPWFLDGQRRQHAWKPVRIEPC